MTLVARFEVSNSPVLVGDLLISGPEKTGAAPLKLPTIDDITAIWPKGSGWCPNGVNQKIAIISDRLAVGWAGSSVSASVAIKQLHECVQTHGDDPAIIKRFVESDSFEGSNRTLPLSLTGYGFSDKDSFAFSLNCTDIDTERFGVISLLGTGSDRAQELFRQLSTTQIHHQNAGKVDHTGISGSPELIALFLSGQLISSELVDNASLIGAYGGGYEIACIDSSRKFAKLDVRGPDNRCEIRDS